MYSAGVGLAFHTALWKNHVQYLDESINNVNKAPQGARLPGGGHHFRLRTLSISFVMSGIGRKYWTLLEPRGTLSNRLR
jgi:hypothetical protein